MYSNTSRAEVFLGKVKFEVNRSRNLLMVPDESGLLGPDEVFVQLSPLDKTNDCWPADPGGVVIGPVVVCRSPTWLSGEIEDQTGSPVGVRWSFLPRRYCRLLVVFLLRPVVPLYATTTTGGEREKSPVDDIGVGGKKHPGRKHLTTMRRGKRTIQP